MARNKIFMHSDDNNGLGENLGKGGPYRSPSVADCARLVYIFRLIVSIFLLESKYLL
jgi:hypothetical protein